MLKKNAFLYKFGIFFLIIILLFNFLNIFYLKNYKNILVNIPNIILAFALISQSITVWFYRRIATILFVLSVALKLFIGNWSLDGLGIISNIIILIFSLYFIVNNILEIKKSNWILFPFYKYFIRNRSYANTIKIIVYLFKKNKYKKVIKYINQTSKYCNETEYLYYYGSSKIMTQDYNEGEIALNKIKTDTAFYTEAKYYLGVSFFNQNKINIAIKYFEDYLNKHPKNLAALHFRAYINSINGFDDISIPDFTEIINQSQDAGVFYFARGLCYSKIGNLIKAQEDWISAANCVTPDEWALVRLAEIENNNNNYLLALHYFKKAYKIDKKIKKKYAIIIKELKTKIRNITTAST